MKKSDIEFHFGYRKCGKSELVEQILAGYKDKIYVGTLPLCDEYKLTINKHVQRRGNEWTTINLTHDLNIDLEVLHQTLKISKSPVVGMLDGLWTWYIFTNNKCPIRPIDFALKIYPILDKLDILRIVDIGSYVLEELPDSKQKIEIIHEVLADKLNIKKMIDYRYERI